MEERKLDKSSLIGMILISLLLGWFLISNQNSEDVKEAKKEQQKEVTSKVVAANSNDSIATQALKASLGDFAYSGTLASAQGGETKVENELLKFTFSNKGGFLSKLEVKGQKRINKDSGELVQIIKNNNSALNLKLATKDNRVLNTQDLFFEPTVTKEGDNQVVSMKLKTSENTYLEYRYLIKPDDYMIDFSLRTVGLEQVLNPAVAPELSWSLKTIRNEKSISYENRYTELVYEYEGGKDSYLSNTSKEVKETEKEVSYIAFKQHLFTSVLLTDQPFSTAELSSKNLVEDEKVDTLYTKDFSASMPLVYKGGALNYNFNMYFGPADYQILNKYGRNLDEIVPLGWGIFGWLNKFIFVPLFGFLTTLIPHGISIVIFTILVRLLMSPIQYKSYVSQAKMKAVRPEILEINEKYKKDPMKKQQETMALYSKAGINPMAGCIPMLVQIPVFYALFQFFPSAFDLRQKGFLWTDDLSSYDSIYTLPFHIPFYGNHVSLFPILAAIATFVYMKMTTGDQAASTPQQEGMPDMSQIMKIMIYISPIMMLFFFNNYASGLSLYYFISNVITIGIMYVIKNKIVTEEKVKNIIETNRSKERPKSKFQRKMEEMMEQAQQQQQNRKN